MGDFPRCIDFILAEEGGLANHRRDPGGLTKYGISQRSYPDLNITALTKESAVALYRRDYWNPMHGDELPAGLDLLLLDCAINQGPVTAIRLLQEALKLDQDGVLGPITLANVRRTLPNVLPEFCALRAWRYEINRHEDAFGKGWFRRLFRLFALARDWSRTS
jgi:lysozyme family protein